MNRDYRDLFAACNDHEVRFLVVGAYAVTFHARPRFTKDLFTSPSCRDRRQPGRAQWLT